MAGAKTFLERIAPNKMAEVTVITETMVIKGTIS